MVVLVGSPIGDRIVSLRRGRVVRGRSMTQGQLAEYAGVGRSWLSQVETGDIANPGALDLYPVARVLGVSLDYLVSGAQEPDGIPVYVEPQKAGYFQRWKRFAVERLQSIDTFVGAWTSDEGVEDHPEGGSQRKAGA